LFLLKKTLPIFFIILKKFSANHFFYDICLHIVTFLNFSTTYTQVVTTDHPSITDLLRGTTTERQKAIRVMVKDQKLLSEIMAYIVKQNGHPDDATMIFHDSIIAFAKKVFTDRSLVIQGSFSGYIFGIAKNLWLVHLRKEKKHHMVQSLENHTQDQPGEENFFSLIFNKEKTSLLNEVLDQLVKPCKEVLLYWAGGYNMIEIAQKLGYKTDGVARKKKFFCFKSLIEWLESRPHILQALKNEI
jgi:DNA-directed RNA polymerase specialized sigma24 family protein